MALLAPHGWLQPHSAVSFGPLSLVRRTRHGPARGTAALLLVSPNTGVRCSEMGGSRSASILILILLPCLLLLGQSFPCLGIHLPAKTAQLALAYVREGSDTKRRMSLNPVSSK